MHVCMPDILSCVRVFGDIGRIVTETMHSKVVVTGTFEVVHGLALFGSSCTCARERTITTKAILQIVHLFCNHSFMIAGTASECSLPQITERPPDAYLVGTY